MLAMFTKTLLRIAHCWSVYHFPIVKPFIPTPLKELHFTTRRHLNVNEPPAVYEDSFDEDVYETATLFVPEGKLDTYRTHEIWSKFKKISDGTASREYTFNISSVGNGNVLYNGEEVRENSKSFVVEEGANATITFTPDDGYRIKTVKVNNSTVSVTNNRYTISSINANTTVSVEFEAIPPTIYTLSITASGNGSATYGSTAIRNNTRSFTVNEGTSATISFTPDDGYRIKSVKENNSSVSVSKNQYTISSINANTTVSVEFEAIPPTTYTLSITASGNGSATYGSTAIPKQYEKFHCE